MLSLQISTSEVGLRILEESINYQIINTKHVINNLKSTNSSLMSENAQLMTESVIQTAENEIKEARIILTQIQHHKKMNNIEWECELYE